MSIIKKINVKFIISFVVSLVVGSLVMWLALLISRSYDTKAWFDATFFGALIIFASGWLLFSATTGIFDTIVYGVKAFGLALVGKKNTKSFIEYRESHQSISKSIYFGIYLASLFFLIAALVLYIIYKSQ